MRVLVLSLGVCLFALSHPSHAQCIVVPQATYGGYSGYAPYNAYYAPYVSYAPPPYTPTYAPYRARQPAYPVYSAATPAANYGRQTSYFRGQPGPVAPPGGTFFGGYDYQVTYPPDWYGGYWTWW